jgi:hypothetical protein
VQKINRLPYSFSRNTYVVVHIESEKASHSDFACQLLIDATASFTASFPTGSVSTKRSRLGRIVGGLAQRGRSAGPVDGSSARRAS